MTDQIDSMVGDPGSPLFAEVTREPNLSDKVVESIMHTILSGQLSPGERLPSERELAEQFNVSRTVIREAVRSLSAHGLVETRSGRGVQVAQVDGDAISRSMSLYLRGKPSIDYSQIHEVRSALEVQIAALAAERATERDLAKLAQINENMRRIDALGTDLEQAAELDLEFHRTIAAATQNELFVVTLDSIANVLLEIRRTALAAPGVLGYALRAHQEILDRLHDHDVGQAREAMRTHLEVAERAWAGSGEDGFEFPSEQERDDHPAVGPGSTA